MSGTSDEHSEWGSPNETRASFSLAKAVPSKVPSFIFHKIEELIFAETESG